MRDYGLLAYNNALFPSPHLLDLHTNDFKEKNMRHWRTRLVNLYQNSCIVTGLKGNVGQVSLVAHHLYSQSRYPQLSKNFYNGVLLENNLHKLYHKEFGKDPGSVTPGSFISFVNSLSLKKVTTSKRPTLVF
jgi:hypothetical protein